MSHLKSFRERTYKTAAQLKNIKVSTIRLAEAKANNFQTIKSYENHLSKLDRNSLFISKDDWVMYLTNSCLESCLDSGDGFFSTNRHLFRSLDMDFDSFSEDYPLTNEEVQYISDDNEIFVDVVNKSTNYKDRISLNARSTALVNGKKHFTVEWREYVQSGDEYHSLENLSLAQRHIEDTVFNIADKTGGKVIWEKPDDYPADADEVYFCLFIPFDYIINNSSDCTEYMELLGRLFKES